jgi:hypothetical protein
LLHTHHHNHHSGADTIGQLVGDVPIGLSLALPQEAVCLNVAPSGVFMPSD